MSSAGQDSSCQQIGWHIYCVAVNVVFPPLSLAVVTASMVAWNVSRSINAACARAVHVLRLILVLAMAPVC
jgi:hypothetical protein